jgi:phosphoenolpyruvate carboxykinase (GTP)
VISDEWQDPNGVPISAILFGGRRATVVPLVAVARAWEHGTFMGSIISSEKTAAAAGKVGELRRDPMAMLPFCGYNMGDYWSHWLDIGRKQGAQMPLVYYVNWFRKSDTGKFLWPGFGENSRVLKWVFERCNGSANAVDTPIGNLPTPESLDLDGLNVDEDALKTLLTVDREGWLQELPLIRDYYARFGDRMPNELTSFVDNLEKELSA